MHILCFLLACAQSVLIMTPLYFWLKACIKSFYVFNMRSHTDLNSIKFISAALYLGQVFYHVTKLLCSDPSVSVSRELFLKILTDIRASFILV